MDKKKEIKQEYPDPHDGIRTERECSSTDLLMEIKNVPAICNGDDHEMEAYYIQIKKEPSFSDSVVNIGRDCLSSDMLMNINNGPSICSDEYEINNETEIKKESSTSGIVSKNERICFSSDQATSIKNDSVVSGDGYYIDNTGRTVEDCLQLKRTSLETECQPEESYLLDWLLQNKNKGTESKSHSQHITEIGLCLTKERVMEERSRTVSLKRTKINQRKEEKRKRNAGLDYTTVNRGINMAKREIGEDCKCKKHCYENVGQELRGKIFSEFWGLGNYELQNAYLHGRIKVTTIKRRYTKKGDESRRCNSVVYTILKDSVELCVCKVAFLNIHGLQKSRGRVEQMVQKIASGQISPPLDRRGLHETRKNALSEEQKQFVLDHINKIPKYNTHYIRKDNSHRIYVGYEHSISSIYDHYVNNFCKEKSVKPVSLDKYKRIFSTLNIAFKHPKSDTCKTCDTFCWKIRDCRLKNDEKNLRELRIQQELHHRNVEAGMVLIKKYRELAKSEESTYMFTFDLQQALPLPKLNIGPTFYSRKLWCYNFSVHDCKSDVGYFYLWDEPTAGRGPEEIISCLKKHVEKFDVKGEKLILISDNCGNQNKNWSMVAFWSYLIASGRFEHIEHHFPISGHMMLPSDQDFSHVESYVRRHVQVVYTPQQWVEIIEKSAQKKKVKAIQMIQEDFVSLDNLKNYFTFRTKTAENELVQFNGAVTFSCSAGCPMQLNIKYHCNGEDVAVNLCPRREVGSPAMAVFSQKYDRPRKIDPSKMKDISVLKNYIPNIYLEEYYNKLNVGHRPEGELDEEENDKLMNGDANDT